MQQHAHHIAQYLVVWIVDIELIETAMYTLRREGIEAHLPDQIDAPAHGCQLVLHRNISTDQPQLHLLSDHAAKVLDEDIKQCMSLLT
ncbi:hypothetical protein D3C77_619670 [compost metagenome]